MLLSMLKYKANHFLESSSCPLLQSHTLVHSQIPLPTPPHPTHTAMPQSNEDDSSAPTLMEEMMMAASIGPRPLPPPKSQKADTATFGSGFKAGFLNKTSSHEGEDTRRQSSSSSQSAISTTSPSSAPSGLVEKLSSSPTLRTALENPRFRVILAELGRDPQATLARYQHDGAAMGFLRELMGALGKHFEELGKQQQQQQTQGRNKINAAGPLVQAALEKGKQQKIQQVDDIEQEKAEQEAVNRILRDPELRELLLNPAMQMVLQSCAGSDNGSGLAQYMRDPVMAAKLRKLADAGLIQIK